jgi:hypothetical protein
MIDPEKMSESTLWRAWLDEHPKRNFSSQI